MLQKSRDNTCECIALLCPEPEGVFSAFALCLPGVVSQGETEDEALENLADAFRGAIAGYRELGIDFPWDDVAVDRTAGSLERRIFVDVE